MLYRATKEACERSNTRGGCAEKGDRCIFNLEKLSGKDPKKDEGTCRRNEVVDRRRRLLELSVKQQKSETDLKRVTKVLEMPTFQTYLTENDEGAVTVKLEKINMTWKYHVRL